MVLVGFTVLDLNVKLYEQWLKIWEKLIIEFKKFNYWLKYSIWFFKTLTKKMEGFTAKKVKMTDYEVMQTLGTGKILYKVTWLFSQ